MKKIITIAIFVFLTGLFSGLFFSTDLSPDNHDHLSSLLLTGLSSSSGFFRSLLSNLIPAAFMLPALFTGLLCPLPMAVLFFKSFSLGFCSGLIQTAAPDDAFLISLLKFFPQNLFFIPAFIIIASVAFYCSITGSMQKNRPSRKKKGLKNAFVLSLVLILAGCITQESFRLIAL